MRVFIVSAIALVAFAAIASAQIVRPGGVTTTPAPQTQNNNAAQVAPTTAQLQSEIQRLRTQVQQLTQQRDALQQQVTQMTTRGGSLVHAYCEAQSVSRNTAGARQDCGYYACAPVTGTCNSSCNTTTECEEGYAICENHRCVARNGR
jgi:TolA-binding protein